MAAAPETNPALIKAAKALLEDLKKKYKHWDYEYLPTHISKDGTLCLRGMIGRSYHLKPQLTDMTSILWYDFINLGGKIELSNIMVHTNNIDDKMCYLWMAYHFGKKSLRGIQLYNPDTYKVSDINHEEVIKEAYEYKQNRRRFFADLADRCEFKEEVESIINGENDEEQKE